MFQPVSGYLMARAGQLEIMAGVELRRSTVAVRDIMEDDWTEIDASSPEATALVDSLSDKLVRFGRVPPKPKKLPEMVMCPDCLSIEPEVWECETCRQGGKVPR